MKPALALTLVLAAVPAAAALRSATELAFAAEAGSGVRKTFEEETSWELVSLARSVAGQSAEEDVPDLHGTSRRRTIVIDQHERVEGGRPARLVREFEEAGGSVDFTIEVEGMAEAYEFSVVSLLVERAVVFTWDEEELEYAAAWDEGSSGDSVLLEGLNADMDALCVLPDGDVGPGDTWELDPSVLVSLFAHGGNLAHVPDEMPAGPYEMVTPVEVLTSSSLSVTNCGAGSSGEASATWRETYEEDGREIALIEIEFELDLEGDIGAFMTRSMEAADVGSDREDLEGTIEWEIEGEGQVLWDLTAGHFVSLTLEGDSAIEATMTWEQLYGEQSFPVGMEFGLEGSTSIVAEAGAE